MQENFTLPSYALKELKAMGYRPDTRMQGHVQEWFSWYTSTAPWYDYDHQIDATHKVKVHRMSIHSARRVCREWASLLMNDADLFTAADADADEWLQAWMAATDFVAEAQGNVERGFALGTSAWALWFAPGESFQSIQARRYDARQIIPLSWDHGQCTECAFMSHAMQHGRKLVQLQAHVFSDETETYHIITKLWADEKPVVLPEVEPDFDTGTKHQTFQLMRPAIENVYEEFTPMGQSVFADAVDAIKAVDNCFDSMSREVDATKVKVFMSDDLFDVKMENGQRQILPMSPDNMVIRKVAGNGVESMYEVFAPNIRADQLRTMMDSFLSELSDLCGFGKNYFSLERAGGLKTATEVAADNSDLMRNIRKHENLLGKAVAHLLEAVLDCARTKGMAQIPEGCTVNVRFDDSIITDTQSEKTTAMTEIAAGIMQKWEYRCKFFGEDAETAQSMVEMQPAIDEGGSL